jgi:hypothetical protein
MKNQNLKLNKENWRVLTAQSQPKGQWLILLVDHDSANVIEQTDYRVFTGLTELTFTVLSWDPKWDKELIMHLATTASMKKDGCNRYRIQDSGG